MDNNIKLDLREELPDYASRRTVQVKEGEKGILLKFQILEFGKPKNITGHEVRFKATLPDGWEVVDFVDVADAESGFVTYTTPLELCSCPGVFWPYLEIRLLDNTFIDATRSFRMQCVNGTDVTVDANYVPELYKFVTEGQIAIASCNEATNKAVEATAEVSAAVDDAIAATTDANAAARNGNAATAQAQKATAQAQGAAENCIVSANSAIAIANAIASGRAGDEEVAAMRAQIDQLGHLLSESTASFVIVGTTLFAPKSKASVSGTRASLPTSTVAGTTIKTA
ncbi:MAG: BppU family phage baseplate upper protein [Gordonibacter sp.]|uniref:BppU family phage baseplate upper protein n=1 Tax=Gordonibacter sp. TaxID=1968902 RepID=UPI002FC98C10